MSIRALPAFSTDQVLFDGLSRRDERAYAFIYSESFPSFRYWVLSNNGSEMDAEDAFQKGLLSFLLNLETGQYQLQANARITTVIFEYCKKSMADRIKIGPLKIPNGYAGYRRHR